MDSVRPSVQTRGPGPRLYSEAFTGRARCIARCGFCLRDDHMTQTCPRNPNSSTQAWGQESPVWPQPTPLLSQQPLGSQPQDICRRYNDMWCRFPCCRFRHACLSCGGAHPQRDCTQRTTRLAHLQPHPKTTGSALTAGLLPSRWFWTVELPQHNLPIIMYVMYYL